MYAVAKPAGLFSPAIVVYIDLHISMTIDFQRFERMCKKFRWEDKIVWVALPPHVLIIQYGLSIRKIIENLSAQNMMVNLIFGAVLVPRTVSPGSGNSRLSVTSDWPISFSYPEPREWYWPIKSDTVARAVRDGSGYENDFVLKISLHSQFLLRFLVQFSPCERYEQVIVHTMTNEVKHYKLNKLNNKLNS